MSLGIANALLTHSLSLFAIIQTKRSKCRLNEHWQKSKLARTPSARTIVNSFFSCTVSSQNAIDCLCRLLIHISFQFVADITRIILIVYDVTSHYTDAYQLLFFCKSTEASSLSRFYVYFVLLFFRLEIRRWIKRTPSMHNNHRTIQELAEQVQIKH